MSHELEILDGVAQMAYAGTVPWHGLGKSVSNDLTPAQMAEEAGVNWSVTKTPGFYNWTNPEGIVETKSFKKVGLIRDFDGKLLSEVGPEWNIVQNAEAAEFFHEFVMAGDMEMHTAGSLKGGQIVWFLAKTKNGFDLFGGRDPVEQYILFSNFHDYGKSTDIRDTDVRVVCNNTFSAAHGKDSATQVKVHHRKKFDAEMVKKTMAKSDKRLQTYREQAGLLCKARFTPDTLMTYFDRVFPNVGKTEEAQDFYSRNASLALDVMDTQPGAELGEGTFWQAFNAVTYLTDHVVGNDAVKRLTSSWYGQNRDRKTKAMDIALEMAAVA
jgi:phage/plasmid-like protein (TIGR03299 family)